MSGNFIGDDIKTSLEYYDANQPRVNEIINKTEYIKTKDNNNITDEILFYDKNKKLIFKSSYEIISVYIPSTGVWKWAWSLPTAPKKSTSFSRKLLDYAFNLDSKDNEFLLRSTLINSKIKIINKTQLDIYLSLTAKLSKKPFILKTFVSDVNVDSDGFYPFRKINDDPNNVNYIVMYLLILDF
jgi:hypothetical protein